VDALIETLISLGRAAHDAGLVISTSGNASLRATGGTFVVTATGASLGALRAEDIATVALSDGRQLAGPTPSVETEIHRRALLARPAARAVLHCQSPAATLLACMADPPRDLDFVPEIPAYVRAHAYVPFALPGSEALAAAVHAALEADLEVTVVQLANHGQLVLGESVEDTVRRARFFELACWLASQGRPLATIPQAEARALASYGRRSLD
jgi:ribulose-5-phosphate 4-epimerase/fuculose-1-phosphate aldolase